MTSFSLTKDKLYILREAKTDLRAEERNADANI